MTLGHDDLDELANEVRRLIESNKAFLERVTDEDYDDEEEAEPATEEGAELVDYEEL
ncbi:hypothetical protein Gbem_3399 [Citrifermentans bemidjiense Bem]|uniref:Uncharacterized protein n=1 Tax=Citrifermentans bemidjiense (strain ATCC BAA-1014 / DSM 16622 / JCM 12645 / Bem) TaxID=404380 RepID=B5EBA2_CITBB|nr:hypothetical protein [Citrifermentans bemidjiense]ACH40394.1 hypothetical protein Gbem_3399 [Citrifermentans bemidjiense Bem]